MRDLGLQFGVVAQIVGKAGEALFALFAQGMVGIGGHIMKQFGQAVDDSIGQPVVEAGPAHDGIGAFLDHRADQMFVRIEGF